MQMLKKIGEGILFGGFVLLIFLLLTEQHLLIPLWLQVVGRMHPMFVHFPIVLLLLSFGIYWIGMPEPENSWILVLRLLAAISAVITAIMGFLLAVEDGRSGTLLQWHKWSGVALALAGFVFYLFYDYLRRKKIAGKVMTLLATAGIVFTGHFGADLTHGEHYLMEPVTSKAKKVVALDQALVFGDVIEPIFEKKCGGCHVDGNIKGGLVLLDSVGLERGGKTGPLFIPGDPYASLLIKRITMPPDQKKHMPPLSKPALTLEEIALLKAWIKNGPVMNKKLISIPAKDSFYLLATKSLGPGDNTVPQIHYDFPAADEKIVKALNNNFRAIEPQGAGSPALSVHFYGIKMYSRKSLEELLPVKRQIIQLSLARMPVADDEAGVIAQMINLQTLNLNYTDITGKALQQLANLKKLKEIALAGTKIDVASLKSICALPEMESVYVWNIKFDSVAFQALRKRYAKVDIQSGFVDKGQFIVELSPPLILTEAGISDSTLLIKLKHPLKGVDIRYTLNGKQPDSANSIPYTKPFPLDTSARLSVRAFHKGWLGSSPVQADYIRRTAKPDSIELTSNPDPKYKYLTSKLLSDKDLGGTYVNNGQWLGYQKTPAVYYLDYDTEAMIHCVLLNVMLDTGSNIFPPVRVKVWGGKNRNHLHYLAKIEPDSGKDKSTRAVLEKISFGPQKLKYLKIVAEPRLMDAYLRRLKKKDPWMYISEIVVN